MRFIFLSIICFLSLLVDGEEGQVNIRWNNGDLLSGYILPSEGSVLRFSSEIFNDDLVIIHGFRGGALTLIILFTVMVVFAHPVKLWLNSYYERLRKIGQADTVGRL